MKPEVLFELADDVTRVHECRSAMERLTEGGFYIGIVGRDVGYQVSDLNLRDLVRYDVVKQVQAQELRLLERLAEHGIEMEPDE